MDVTAMGSTAHLLTLAAASNDPASSFNWIGPIANVGLVGVFFLLVILRLKVMPTYVMDDARKEWERERAALEKDIEELKNTLREANTVYTTQVIPTLTRVLDAERELVDLRREEQAERRRRGGE